MHNQSRSVIITFFIAAGGGRSKKDLLPMRRQIVINISHQVTETASEGIA
jgi:hypothetical protein